MEAEASATWRILDIVVHGCLTSPSDAVVALQEDDDGFVFF